MSLLIYPLPAILFVISNFAVQIDLYNLSVLVTFCKADCDKVHCIVVQKLSTFAHQSVKIARRKQNKTILNLQIHPVTAYPLQAIMR